MTPMKQTKAITKVKEFWIWQVECLCPFLEKVEGEGLEELKTEAAMKIANTRQYICTNA